MKIKPGNILMISLGLALLFSSCKRKGCTDDKALNFDPKAEKNDGSCEFAPDSGTFYLEFAAYNGNNQIQLDKFYSDPVGQDFIIEMLSFYVSNITLTGAENGSMELKDVELISFENNKTSVSFKAPVDDYSKIQFGIGLDAKQNATDPTGYSDDHPMSVTQNTYWSWNSKYRFVMLEGRVDTTGNQDYIGFSYHTGFDENYRILKSSKFKYNLGAGDLFRHHFHIDFQKVFFNSKDTIDYTDPSQTQSHSQTPLATRISDNFLDAVKEE